MAESEGAAIIADSQSTHELGLRGSDDGFMTLDKFGELSDIFTGTERSHTGGTEANSLLSRIGFLYSHAAFRAIVPQGNIAELVYVNKVTENDIPLLVPVYVVRSIREALDPQGPHTLLASLLKVESTRAIGSSKRRMASPMPFVDDIVLRGLVEGTMQTFARLFPNPLEINDLLLISSREKNAQRHMSFVFGTVAAS